MKEVIFAGFGGQGVLTAGLILANAAMKKDVMVSWMPSYGPAMRGGTANACVKFGDGPGDHIGAPTMRRADIAVIMNEPSLSFLKFCKEDAVVFVNSNSVPGDAPIPAGMRVCRLNSDQIAYECANPKGTSIVMLGALIRACGIYDPGFVEAAMDAMFAEKGKSAFQEANDRAFRAGCQAGERYV